MNTILQGVVGSHAYGLATSDSDVDRLAVHLGPIGDVLAFGLGKHQQTKASSNPDKTSHDVAKFVSLCIAGNPTVTELLWLPEYEIHTKSGDDLVSHRESFLAAKRVHDAYGGYAFHQLHRLLNRHAEGKDGFSADTKKRTAKHARHLMRLLLQGSQLLREGRLDVRLTEDQAVYCRETGEIAQDGDLTELKSRFNRFLAILDADYERTVLPKTADVEGAKALLQRIRLRQLGVL